MTFDVVISNPPYQNNTTSIYDKFIELGLEISSKMCMITRNNWLKSDTLKETRKKMVEAGIQEIINYPKIGEVFRGLNVAVSIFNIDKNKDNNNTTYKEICNGEIKNEYTLTSNPAVIFKNTYENSIYAKVKSALESDTFSKFVLPVEPFKLTSGGIVGRGDNAYELDMRNQKDNEYDVGVWRMERNGVPFGSYCKFDDVPARSELVDTYKIICGKVLKNSGTVISNLRAIEIHSICDSSWAVLYHSENGEEVLNVQKYISTKFFRFLVSIVVDDGVIGVSPYRFSLIPLQDFTSTSDIDWSKDITEIDQQLYQKYNLMQDEIAYIENNILPIT